MVKFNKKSKPETKANKDKKGNTFDSVNAFDEGRELSFNAFKSRIFLIKKRRKRIENINY